jgi:excisionase family DNA binding protein
MNQSPTFVHIHRLAHELGLPKKWLLDEAKSGRIPAVKAGRLLRFDVAEVRKALTAPARGKAVPLA